MGEPEEVGAAWPDWYFDFRAARLAGVPPWEMAGLVYPDGVPRYYYDRLIIMDNAEREAHALLEERAARRARQG